MNAWLGHVFRRIGMWTWLVCLVFGSFVIVSGDLYASGLLGYVGMSGEISWWMAGTSMVLLYCAWWFFKESRKQVKRWWRGMKQEKADWIKYKQIRWWNKRAEMTEKLEKKIAKGRGEEYFGVDLDLEIDS